MARGTARDVKDVGRAAGDDTSRMVRRTDGPEHGLSGDRGLRHVRQDDPARHPVPAPLLQGAEQEASHLAAGHGVARAVARRVQPDAMPAAVTRLMAVSWVVPSSSLK